MTKTKSQQNVKIIIHTLYTTCLIINFASNAIVSINIYICYSNSA